MAADIAHYQRSPTRGAETPRSSRICLTQPRTRPWRRRTTKRRAWELYDPYYITLLKPWAVRGLEPYQYAFRVTPEMALDFYGALAASLQDSLDEGMGGEWVYSPGRNERSGPIRSAGVAEPIGYGWSGGWDNILDCAAFLVFAIFAVCVTVTPLFASGYREGTDAVLLSSLNGRGRLAAAKLAAAVLYATALFAVAAAIVCGVSLAFDGAGGADLAIQNYALGLALRISRWRRPPRCTSWHSSTSSCSGCSP